MLGGQKGRLFLFFGNKKINGLVKIMYRQFGEGMHNYTINMPLYCGAQSVFVGVKKGSKVDNGRLISADEIEDIVAEEHVEEITEEPNPKDYVGGSESEAYKEALDRWLRYLQGQYMSAVWGQEIEKLIAGKGLVK